MSIPFAFLCMFIIGLLSGVILTVFIAYSIEKLEDEELDAEMREAVRYERAKESPTDILSYNNV